VSNYIINILQHLVHPLLHIEAENKRKKKIRTMDGEEASSGPFTGFGEKNNFLTRGAGERKRKREIDKFLLIFNFQSSACSK